MRERERTRERGRGHKRIWVICTQSNVTWLLLTMETQIEEEIQHVRSLRIPRNSSDARDLDIDNLQYTSLKDIICNTPRGLTLYEENDLDSSICIRNELVKRAASVYLQSAALLVTRNQNCFESFWERLKNKAASRWRLSGYPFRACFLPIYHFLNHMVGTIRSLP
ncbi:hypothetical protein VNO78_11151 [Psophocarpus tetragonolobus]|uniref:Uncharacterized protein n=1 Tax=Psophocarpus tetragonolobus TaxID=3891 RepID=A0AAN9XNC8_PSOTE